MLVKEYVERPLGLPSFTGEEIAGVVVSLS